MLCGPSGMPSMVMLPSASDTAVMPVPLTFAVTPISVSPSSASFTVAFNVFWAYVPCAQAAMAMSANIAFFIVFRKFFNVVNVVFSPPLLCLGMAVRCKC